MTYMITGQAGLVGGQLQAPPGTRMLFHMSTPPLGWVTDTTLSDHAVRIVTGAGGGGGAGSAHSTLLGGTAYTSNSVTLATANLPSHTHTLSGTHSHGIGSSLNAFYFRNDNNAALLEAGAVLGQGATASSTTGVTLNNAGTGSSWTTSVTSPALKYAAFVIAQKS